MTAEQPYKVARDTWVIPEIFPVPMAGNLYINTMVITGEQPVIVDTGSAMSREQWLEKAWSIVDPADVRWIFISHDDGDHVGNLLPVLEACPNATVCTSWMAVGRMQTDHGIALPPHRMRLVNDGETIDVGDRQLLAMRPPIFDAPTTRALFDPTTGVLWGSDSFGGFVPGPVHDARDLPEDERWDGFLAFNRLVSPWFAMLDPGKFAAGVDRFQALGVETIATCHGPAFYDGLADEALRRIRQLPGLKAFDEPTQGQFEAFMASAMAGAA